MCDQHLRPVQAHVMNWNQNACMMFMLRKGQSEGQSEKWYVWYQWYHGGILWNSAILGSFRMNLFSHHALDWKTTMLQDALIGREWYRNGQDMPRLTSDQVILSRCWSPFSSTVGMAAKSPNTQTSDLDPRHIPRIPGPWHRRHPWPVTPVDFETLRMLRFNQV